MVQYLLIVYNRLTYIWKQRGGRPRGREALQSERRNQLFHEQITARPNARLPTRTSTASTYGWRRRSVWTIIGIDLAIGIQA